MEEMKQKPQMEETTQLGEETQPEQTIQAAEPMSAYHLPTLEELERMSEVDIRTVSPEDVIDIKDVKIDSNQPREEKMKSYLSQMKNPYVFKTNGVIVKMSFSKNSGRTLTDCLKTLLESGNYPAELQI